MVAPENGMSSESVLFDVDVNGAVDHYVARLAPLPSLVPVFQNYDIEMQAKVMRLVGERTDVPVPEVPFVILDESYLQTPFLVMKRSSGKAPTDVPPYVFGGWVADLSEDDRLLMQRNAVETLVKLHEIRPDNADLSFLDRPQHGTDYLDQHLGHERGYYEWARDGKTFPLIDRTFEWLEANRPTLVNPAVLNWGDARIGNMLWEGPTPSAVLDWEMAAIGPAEVDLAWMIFLHRFFQDMAEKYGMPGLPDFMRREDMAATYTEMSGRPGRGPRVVRGLRRPALRHRVGAHLAAGRHLRADGDARGPRRLRDVPAPGRADARRELLGLSPGLVATGR